MRWRRCDGGKNSDKAEASVWYKKIDDAQTESGPITLTLTIHHHALHPCWHLPNRRALTPWLVKQSGLNLKHYLYWLLFDFKVPRKYTESATSEL